MGLFHRWYVTNHVCFCVSAKGDSAARVAASHGTKLSSGVYPIVTHTKYHSVNYIYIILIYRYILHRLHIYIYINYIYILHNIYIPSYKSPIFVGVGVPMGLRVPSFIKNTNISCPHLSISVPNISSAFRVFACASAQRAVKAACIGRIWRECKMLSKASMFGPANRFWGFKQQINHQNSGGLTNDDA